MKPPAGLPGFPDWLPQEAARQESLERLAVEELRRAGYAAVRLPLVEPEEVFRRSLGATSDIVEKQMYGWEDSGGRRIVLRPEGTAGFVRAFLSASLHRQAGPWKYYYLGPMLRKERPQRGRFRQFQQIGAEFLGEESPYADAEIILLCHRILTAGGARDLTLQCNSIGCPACRPAYRKRLKEYLVGRRDLCENCRRRREENPLRALDCKVDGPKLSDAPKTLDFLCEACRTHWRRLEEILAAEKDLRRKIQPRLVRGLDYYTRTVFEMTSEKLGSQDAVAAGGRYDGLVEQMGGPALPAVGFAIGLERWSEIVEVAAPPRLRAFVLPVEPDQAADAFRLLEDLRHRGVSADGDFSRRSLKGRMRLASQRAEFAVLIGPEEQRAGKVKIKNFATGEETLTAAEEAARTLGC